MALLAAVLSSSNLYADNATLNPIADTSIMEVAPSNNVGARLWVNGGVNMHGERNRALFKFDIAGNIPTGSRITAATLSLTVTGIPSDGYGIGTFDLHRLLRNWGEGVESGGGMGLTAQTNEATWLSPFMFTTNWTTPGAAATNDYAPNVTASQIVYDTSPAYNPYPFPALGEDQSAMIADLQHWLDTSAANFGWILICEDETVTSTARRFGSREDTNNAPFLNIGYVPPITGANVSANRFQLSFAAQQGQAYAIEYATNLATNIWITLTNIPAPDINTNLIVTDGINSPARFYRLRLQ